MDQVEASIAKLTAALDAAMVKAATTQQEEKETNTKTISHAGEAQTAVAQALTVLKEFYAKAGKATSLLQKQPESPEISDTPSMGVRLCPI